MKEKILKGKLIKFLEACKDTEGTGAISKIPPHRRINSVSASAWQKYIHVLSSNDYVTPTSMGTYINTGTLDELLKTIKDDEWMPEIQDSGRNKKDVIKASLRDIVLERDGYRCRYCGTRKGPFHLDHIYPESMGGMTIPENLATSCKNCNLQKSSSIGMWPKPYKYFFVRDTVSFTLFFIGLALVGCPWLFGYHESKSIMIGLIILIVRFGYEIGSSLKI